MASAPTLQVAVVYVFADRKNKDELSTGCCTSCSQSWADEECQLIVRTAKQKQDSNLVKWVKFHEARNEDNEKVKVPTGHICYACRQTHRCHFERCELTIEEVEDRREENDQLNVKWSELRSDKVNGVKRREDVDMKEYHEDVDEEYSDGAEEGTFRNLKEFCDHMWEGERFDCQEDRRRRVTEAGYDILVGKFGEEGVELLDLPAGAYRFKRGRRDAAVRRKSRRIDPEEDGAELMASRLAQRRRDKAESSRHGAKAIAMVPASSKLQPAKLELQDRTNPEGTTTPGLRPSQSFAADSSERGRPTAILEAREADRSRSRSRRRTLSLASARAQSVLAPATRLLVKEEIPASDGAETLVFKSEPADDAGSVVDVGGKKTKGSVTKRRNKHDADSIISDAEVGEREVMEKCSCEKTWYGEVRVRDFTSAMSRLGTLSHRLSTVPRADELHADAAKRAESLLLVKSNLEKTRCLLLEMRKKPWMMTMGNGEVMGEENRAILTQLPFALVVEMLTYIGETLIEKARRTVCVKTTKIQ